MNYEMEKIMRNNQSVIVVHCYKTVLSGQKSHALDATHCGLAPCLPHSHSVTLPAVVLVGVGQHFN